jgi:DNA polymerase-3 subunit alpha
MEIASKVCGFTLGQADILRRAMGKKKSKEMAQQKEFFIEGAVKRGVSHHKATELFNLCEKFAGYGFNKSHSTAYGIISYQTAFLKASYPIEFLAALLTSVMGNTDKVTLYLNECRRLGIKVLSPDINQSDKNFTVTQEGIRFGLSAIKNVGSAAIDSIIQAREKDGRFKSLQEFCQRVESRAVNKKVIESLIKAGAFDSFGAGRAYPLGILEKVLSKVATEQRERQNGQEALFQMQSAVAGFSFPEETAIEEFAPEQKLRMEKEMLGLYISSHPLEYVKDSLEGQTNTKIADISDMREGETVKIGGLLSDCRRLVTKRGDNMLVANIEDMSGNISLVVFPRVYEKTGALLNNDEVVVVTGKINRDMRTDEYNVVAENIEPMVELEKIRSLHIELVSVREQSVLSRMKEILLFYRGEDPVYIRMDGKGIQLGKGYTVDINPELVGQLEELLGSGAVKVEFRAVKREKAAEEISF